MDYCDRTCKFIWMKPQRFKEGQAITLREPGEEWEPLTGKSAYGDVPKFGQIYHLLDYDDVPYYGEWYIRIQEMHPLDTFDEGSFEPVIETSVLEEELEQLTVEV